MRLGNARLLATFLVLLPVSGCGRVHQLTLLEEARERYYDMERAGAKAFACDVRPDWATVYHHPQQSGPTATPWFQYVNQAHLAFTEPLRGTPQVTWLPNGNPPPGKEEAAKRLETSFHQMIEGFLSALQPNLNNTLLPAIPIHDFTAHGDGYQLVEKDMQGRESLITMDKSMKIEHLSVQGPNLSVEMNTTYQESPKGLLLVKMDDLTRTSTTMPFLHSVLETSYALVDGFEVPDSLTVTSADGVQIPMRFTGCHVTR